MERISINNQLTLSRIVQGFWRLKYQNKSPKELLTFIKQCISFGITSFDSADVYMVENILGEALSLQPSIRNEMELITKVGVKSVTPLFPNNDILQYDLSKQHILNSVDNSLKRLKTDHIDLLLLHRPDYLMDPEDISTAFLTLKQNGKVLNFGVSNFTTSQFNLLQSYMDIPLVTNQIEISPLNLESFDNGNLDFLLQKKLHPIAWSPLGGGRIFTQNTPNIINLRKTLNKIKTNLNVNTIDEIIYAWLLKHPSKILPIVGSTNIQRVQLAVHSLDIVLSRSQWYDIFQSASGSSLK